MHEKIPFLLKMLVYIHKLKWNCNTYYTSTCKTNGNFKIRYYEHISEIK
jgi:hypothetical protein